MVCHSLRHTGEGSTVWLKGWQAPTKFQRSGFIKPDSIELVLFLYFSFYPLLYHLTVPFSVVINLA